MKLEFEIVDLKQRLGFVNQCSRYAQLRFLNASGSDDQALWATLELDGLSERDFAGLKIGQQMIVEITAK